MLAKDIKIKRLKRQRDFIEMHLQNMVYRDIDEGIFTCLGMVYKENIVYFQKQGFIVQQMRLRSEEGITYEAYAFIPEDVELTPEELQQAENYDYTEDIVKQKFLEESEGYEDDYYEDDDDLELPINREHKYLS